jgi:oxygen-independent coproporphyrinogen-3 oxidase
MRTLENVIDISPDRIAVYNFAYVPWMKKQQTLIHAEDLPSPEVKLEILTSTIDMLSHAGYEYIGMDHFARPDNELTRARKNKTLHRNFQGYSTKAGSDLYGLGMSAISHFDAYYAQNAKTLPEYYEAIERGTFATHVGYKMNFDDLLRKHVIMRLMCDLSIDMREVEEKFGISFDNYFGTALGELAPLLDDGLMESSGRRLLVTMDGRLFLRNIAMCFDAHLVSRREGKMMYSRTV